MSDDASKWIERHLPRNARTIFQPTPQAIANVLCLMAQDCTGLERGFSQCTFYNLGDGRLVKTGRRVSICEAFAMIFVRAQTTIPVPEVFMVFEHAGIVHIVMELVTGTAFREAVLYDENGMPTTGDGLVTNAELGNITCQLKSIMEELRDLGRRFPSAIPKQPFATVSDFHA